MIDYCGYRCDHYKLLLNRKGAKLNFFQELINLATIYMFKYFENQVFVIVGPV